MLQPQKPLSWMPDDCGWGDRRIIGKVWIPGPFLRPLEDGMGFEARTIYCHCPLCGGNGSIYDGNLYGAPAYAAGTSTVRLSGDSSA